MSSETIYDIDDTGDLTTRLGKQVDLRTSRLDQLRKLTHAVDAGTNYDGTGAGRIVCDSRSITDIGRAARYLEDGRRNLLRSRGCLLSLHFHLITVIA
ncbi:hypothetical protein D9M70_486330 [compost metagenome]